MNAKRVSWLLSIQQDTVLTSLFLLLPTKPHNRKSPHMGDTPHTAAPSVEPAPIPTTLPKQPKARIVHILLQYIQRLAPSEVDPDVTAALRLVTHTLAETLVPRKWEVHNATHVVAKIQDPSDHFVDSLSPLRGVVTKRSVAEAVLEGLKAKVVVEDIHGVVGELRQPSGSAILAKHASLADVPDDDDAVCIAKHIENRVVYTFDVTKIMFSSGNTTERIYHGVATKPGEIVVDMFAGIGYFTLPMLKAGANVVALEKNAVSVKYLRKNALLNKIPPERLQVYEGDNREVGEAHRGTADRVSMGYFNGDEDAAPFLQRALEFVNFGGRGGQGGEGEGGGGVARTRETPVLHYHYLSTKEKVVRTVVEHFAKYVPQVVCCSRVGVEGEAEGVGEGGVREGVSIKGTIVAVRKVKSYRPQVYHFVADVELEVLDA